MRSELSDLGGILMYQINDYVVFGSNGVCQVLDKRIENFGGGTEREYYVLNPLNSRSSTIYAPADKCDIQMRKLLKRDKVLSLLEEMPDETPEWISDNQARKATYGQILQNGDQHELLMMIKVLNQRQADLEEQGKKLSAQDTEFKKNAEALINNEFALVLGMEPEQILPMILDHRSEHVS